MGHELAANPAQFNIPLVLRLVGDLVPQALAQSLDAVIERHAILRSTYGLREEELVQTLIASPRSGLAFVDLTQLPETEASREQRSRVAEERKAMPHFESLREGKPSKRDRRDLERLRYGM